MQALLQPLEAYRSTHDPRWDELLKSGELREVVRDAARDAVDASVARLIRFRPWALLIAGALMCIIICQTWLLARVVSRVEAATTQVMLLEARNRSLVEQNKLLKQVSSAAGEWNQRMIVRLKDLEGRARRPGRRDRPQAGLPKERNERPRRTRRRAGHDRASPSDASSEDGRPVGPPATPQGRVATRSTEVSEHRRASPSLVSPVRARRQAWAETPLPPVGRSDRFSRNVMHGHVER